MPGKAPVRPLLRGRDQGLLDRVLGQVEMAVAAHQRGQGLGGKVVQQALEVVGCGHISTPPGLSSGRTSMPHSRASGHRAAISTARSWVSQSTTQ